MAPRKQARVAPIRSTRRLPWPPYQRMRDRQISLVLQELAPCGDRGDGDALIDDRDAVVAQWPDRWRRDHGVGGDLTVNVVASRVDVVRRTVEQREMPMVMVRTSASPARSSDWSRGPQVFGMVYFLTVCFRPRWRGLPVKPTGVVSNLWTTPPAHAPPWRGEISCSPESDTVHLGEDLFRWQRTRTPMSSRQDPQGYHHGTKSLSHWHSRQSSSLQISVDDGLRNIKHVDVVLGRMSADAMMPVVS